MLQFNWKHWLSVVNKSRGVEQSRRRTPAKQRPIRRQGFRNPLRLEFLEDRTCPTLINVTNVGFTATEGTPFSGTVASFTDTELTSDPTQYSATISWGDGTTSTGTVAYTGTPGNFTVNASAAPHTYAEEGTQAGSFSVTITQSISATLANGGFETGDFGGWTVGGTSPFSGVATAGTLIPGTAAVFGPTFVSVRTGTYAAYADIANSNGVFLTLSQTLDLPSGTYQTGYYLAVDSPGFGAYGAGGNAISVNGSSIPLIPLPPPGFLTAKFQEFSGSFTTDGGLTTLQYQISGSGTGNAGVSIDDVFLTGGPQQATTVSTPPTSPSVADAPLTAGTVTASGGVEGVTPTSLSATFTDANLIAPTSDFSGTINWGDNNTTTFNSSAMTGSGGSYTVTASHQYAEETPPAYAITVTINDNGSSTTDTGSTSVADAPLTAGTVSASGGVEGVTPTSLSATFTDANLIAPTSDFSGTINWGDSNTTTFNSSAVTGSGGSYSLAGSHLYAEEGTYNLTITVNDAGGQMTTLTGTTAVGDSSVAVTGGFTMTGVEGVALTAQTVATFIDPGGAEAAGDYAASIAWGDGTSSGGSISAPDSSGVYTVTGTHTYGQESAPDHPGSNPYAITVTISHEGARTAAAASNAIIGDATPVAGPIVGTLSAIPGQTVFVSAPFSDSGTSDTHSGTFSWGDSTTTTVRAVESSGSGTVSSSHVYASPGTYTVTLTVADEDGSQSAPVSYTLIVGQSALLLNAHANGALMVSGNGSLTIPGLLQVDSNSTSAITASGSASVTASQIDVVGGFQVSGTASFHPTPTTGVPSMADPLAGLPAPSASGLTNYGAVNLSGSSSLVIHPGIYSQINVSGLASLTMTPGIYVLAGGGFVVSGGGSVTGTGVFLYNAGSNYPNAGGNFGGITVSGNGTVALSPPAAGQPYTGILIFQARDNTRALSFSGNGMVGTAGTIYTPAAMVNLSGNGTLQGTLVVNTLTITGNADSTLTADGTSGSSNTAGTLLAGNLTVYVDNSSGNFTTDELARVDDAIAALDAVVNPFGVNITRVGAADSAWATTVITMAATSASGSAADGVLGCENGGITIVTGWNWYTAADPSAVGAGQYDFETIVMHELGHSLGLGHSADVNSVMNATLASGTAHRTLFVADLNIPDLDAGACALHAAPDSAGNQPGTASFGVAPLQAIVVSNVLSVPVNRAAGWSVAWDTALAYALTASSFNGPSPLVSLSSGWVAANPIGGHGNILVAGEGDSPSLGGLGTSVLMGSFGHDETGDLTNEGGSTISSAALDLAFMSGPGDSDIEVRFTSFQSVVGSQQDL